MKCVRQLELNRRDFTLEERGTTDHVYIRGPKKDLDKRQATIQVCCVRVKGDQTVAPTLIFRNANPAENRYEMPSGNGLKNSSKRMQTKKVTQKEVLMNLIKSDALCLQK